MAAIPALGLEIPAFGASAAFSAATLGATRIELNAQGSYGEGGLTPSIEDLEQFVSSSSQRCPLRIMIRPRGPPVSSSPEAGGVRDFHYNDEEFKIMEASIMAFKNSGLLDTNKGDGFVLGILEQDGHRCWVDKKRCSHLVQIAQPFKCVFHRAFDEIVSCDDLFSDGPIRLSWETGIQDVAACGFHGILTSGGLGKAIDNMQMLESVIRKAQTLHIEIIVGGGVRTANVGEIIRGLGLWERAGSVYLHSACLCGNGGEDINPEEVQGILAQLRY
ncbi:hypothetical protein F4803DRAFT_308078 [Xylaria telfairii]|nr:hypothetical protein F4803DRAFT_308078 [Xylaria telfairii]